jgi:hypothetical protein
VKTAKRTAAMKLNKIGFELAFPFSLLVGCEANKVPLGTTGRQSPGQIKEWRDAKP